MTVPYNEARYGRSSDDPTTNGDDPNVCADVVCDTSYDLVRDSVNKWYSSQIAQGRTKAEALNRAIANGQNPADFPIAQAICGQAEDFDLPVS